MMKLNSYKVFILVAIASAFVLVTLLIINNESRTDKISRLNSVAKSLPKFNGATISSDTDVDGECDEVSSSSALPALRYKSKLSLDDFNTAKSQFINESEQEGIEWSNSTSSSTLFERDEKKYKLRFTQYSAPVGYYGIDLTACD